MKKTVLTALFLSYCAFHTAWVMPATFYFDPLQTSVLWSITHDSFSVVHGKFTRIKGAIVLDDEQPEASTVKAIITLDYNYTGIDNLDARLKTKDFFNIYTHPTAVYTSTKVTVVDKDKGKYKIEGTLELNSFKKPIILDVILNKIGIQPETQKKTVGFSATSSLQRTEFGMSFGLPGIGDDVQLDIQAEAFMDDSATS